MRWGTVVSLAPPIIISYNSLRVAAQTLQFEHNPAQTKALGFNSKFGSGGAREMHFNYFSFL